MSKLRRIAEVGDGTYEQMAQKMASVEENEIDSAKRRKKKYISASRETSIEQKNDWEQLKGALKVSQKSFDPENFSSYDTRGQSIRRYESDEEEYEQTFDPRTASNISLHMYADPMDEIREALAKSAMQDAMWQENRLAKETMKLEQSQGWDQEQKMWHEARLKGRNGENISASDMKGKLTKISNENVSESRFGQLDYDAMQNRENQLLSMQEKMLTRHKSIKDSRLDVSKEQKRAQWDNNENIRSQSIQTKTNNSQLFNKLAQITGS